MTNLIPIQLDTNTINKILNDGEPVEQVVINKEEPKLQNITEVDNDEEVKVKEEEREEINKNLIYVECILAGLLFYALTHQGIQLFMGKLLKDLTQSNWIANNLWVVFIIVWYIIRSYIINIIN
jgi:hypothetical protein